MNLKTIGLALVASAFMTSTAFAQAGTMQPIPNPPEKAKTMKHHKKHHMAKKEPAEGTAADKKEDKAEAKAAAKPATPPKK